MEPISIYLQEQYEFVRDSRKALFDYCRSISPEDFTDQNTSFGRGGSMRNLLVHVVNVYEFWIGKIALKKDIVYSEYDSCKNIQDVIQLFGFVDNVMSEFIEQFDPQSQIEYELNDVKSSTTLFKIFSHVITHEYHHKGQVLSISRHLGYIPVDTDIIR